MMQKGSDMPGSGSIHDADREKPAGNMWATIALCVIPIATMVALIGFEQTLTGHFPCDLYQLQADGFREGRLSLPLDGDEVVIEDTSPFGNEIHLSWGPAPAAIYAVADTLFEMLGGAGPAPKVPLFLLFVILHLVALNSILRSWMGTGPAIPLVLTVAYFFTFPFFIFVCSYEIGASQVSILYSSTFFLLGLRTLDAYRHDGALRFARAGGLVGLAILTRPTYWIYGAILAASVLVRMRMGRRALVFASTVAGGVGIHLVYNYLRLGSIFDFGSRIQYKGIWEEFLYDWHVLPYSPEVIAVRAMESVEAWFAPYVVPSYGPALSSAEHSIFLSVAGSVFLMGFALESMSLGRAIQRRWIEVSLAAGFLAVLAFYLLYWNCALRYVIDLWPALFLLGATGLWRSSRRIEGRTRRRIGSAAIFGLLILQMAFNLWMNGFWPKNQVFADPRPGPRVTATPLGKENLSHLVGRPGQNPALECNCGLERREPSFEVTCLDLPKISNSEFFTPWADQQSLHRMGMARLEDGDCLMRFFSGLTMAKTPFVDCWVELALDDDTTPCSDIDLWIEHRASGGMSGQSGHCVLDLPNDERSQIRVFFHFTDTDVDPIESDMRNNLPHHRFRSVRVNCGDRG